MSPPKLGSVASELLADLAARTSFDPPFARKLQSVARDADLAWEDRRVAVLALEHHLLQASPAAFAGAVQSLGIGAEPADLEKQGYRAIDPAGFAEELRLRLLRLAPGHEAFRLAGDAAVLLDLASQECLLTLGRWSFAPDEVVGRIRTLVRTAAGEIDAVADAAYWPAAVAQAIGRLPAYEAAILGRLLVHRFSWWVAPATPSTVNALVEYPIGSAALIIRPPGSTIEFEVKRCGLRGPHPLKVVFEREGRKLPPSHRLQGATSLTVLRWEGSNGALLASLFQAVHGTAAPTSTMVYRGAIKAVPLPGGGEASLPAWLRDPARFGPGFAAQDEAITKSILAFGSEHRRPVSATGPIEERVRTLLGLVPPGQAVLVGTSAFRLDKVAAWLRRDGPAAYFAAALGRAPSGDDPIRFADTILREILGSYRPPGAAGSYRGYVAAAFAEPQNRAAADRAFDAAVLDMGRFWGTLLGLRGYTSGECFVPRNVGLKSVWADGTWQVRIVFMDHEQTNIAGDRLQALEPQLAVPGMHKDWAHILGGQIARQFWPGTLALLGEIYRIDLAHRAAARVALIGAMRAAYRRTVDAVQHDPAVRGHFQPGFIACVPVWDRIVAHYRARHGNLRARQAWPAALRRELRSLGLDTPQMVRQYRRAIRRHGWWLRRCPYLFAPGGDA